LVAELGGRDVPRDRSTRVLDALAALVASGDLDPYVRTLLPFDRVGEALAQVEDGHTLGKVVVTVEA
jgi:NADPH:quinone reductase-like Zn-dependent oxidoreductase